MSFGVNLRIQDCVICICLQETTAVETLFYSMMQGVTHEW